MSSTKSAKAAVSEISHPHESDAHKIGRMIARAFHPLPASQFLVPDPHRRERVYPAYFELAVRDTLQDGTVYVIKTDAAALWMPVPVEGLPPVEFDERLATIDRDLAQRDLAFHSTLHARHPFERGAHHWLVILGTDPSRQSSGLGTRLLAAHHAYLDEKGLGAYLEAASQRAREFYRKLGYVDLDEPIILPDRSQMYPMWRDPQPE